MRAATYWRERWKSEGTDKDLPEGIKTRSKLALVTVMSWPLVLVLLQAGIFTPISSSDFLSSSNDTSSSILMGPVPEGDGSETSSTDSEIDEKEPTPTESASTPGVDPTIALPPEPAPTVAPEPVPSGPATTAPSTYTVKGLEAGVELAGVNPTSVSLNSDAPVVIRTNTGALSPGQTRVAMWKFVNGSKLKLGKTNADLSISNESMAGSDGVRISLWGCGKNWSGTSTKPYCSSGLITGSALTSEKDGPTGIGLGDPGKETYILAAMSIPLNSEVSSGMNSDVSLSIKAGN